MAVTFNFECPKRPNRQGQYPVYVRVTKDRQLKRIKTIVVLEKYADWNPRKQEVRASADNHDNLNSDLEKELEKVKKAYSDNSSATLSMMVERAKTMDEAENTSFLDFMDNFIERHKTEICFGATKHYYNMENKFKAFLKKKKKKTDISFDEVDKELVKDFKAFLGTLKNEKHDTHKLNPSTINAVLRKFRAVVKEAVETEKISKNPIPKGFITADGESHKERLTAEEIARLEALELAEGSNLWHTRNMFLFSLYCAGIRVGDTLQLRWRNIEEGRLLYVMGKTDKLEDITLIPEALAILDLYRRNNSKSTDYIFPLLDSRELWAIQSQDKQGADTMSDELKKVLANRISSKTVILNANLKRLMSLAGIEKHITFHCSRHTFANQALKQGVSAGQIKGLLKHSNLGVTERYTGNFGSAELDKALKQVFSKKAHTQDTSLQSVLANASKEDLMSALMALINKQD